MHKPASLALAALALVATRSVAARADEAFKTREGDTERNGVKIALFEKWKPADEKNWKDNGKVILLVHGATWSSKCTFDPVEGNSLVDDLASQGYDVWTFDMHGYGHSGKTTRDWTDSVAAAEDVDAAADYVRSLRWIEKVHVFGYQWGAQPAALFAEKHPNKVNRLVLFGMRYQATEKKTARDSQYRQNSNANALFKPEDGDLDPEFVRRRAPVCLQNDPKSPNGAVLDMSLPSPVDPTRVKMPTMLIMGERDTEAAVLADRLDFFQKLGARTKVFTVLTGLGKYATFEKSRARFEIALTNFLEQP